MLRETPMKARHPKRRTIRSKTSTTKRLFNIFPLFTLSISSPPSLFTSSYPPPSLSPSRHLYLLLLLRYCYYSFSSFERSRRLKKRNQENQMAVIAFHWPVPTSKMPNKSAPAGQWTRLHYSVSVCPYICLFFCLWAPSISFLVCFGWTSLSCRPSLSQPPSPCPHVDSRPTPIFFFGRCRVCLS